MKLALPSALLIALLSGCATQQPVASAPDAGQSELAQRLASLETKNLAAHSLIGELGQKVASLSADLAQAQKTVAAQAAQIEHDQAARSGAAATLAKHIETSDQRLNTLAGELDKKVGALATDMTQAQKTVTTQLERDQAARSGAAAALARHIADSDKRLKDLASQIAALQKTLQAKADAAQVEHLGAQRQLADTDQSLALQAEAAELADHIDALADQLADLQGQELAAQIEALSSQVRQIGSEQTPKAEVSQLGQRIDSLRDTLAAQQAALSARIANLDPLDARLTTLEKRVDELARNMDDVLAALGLGQRKILGKVVEAIALTEDKTLFPINSPELGDTDKAKLNALGQRLTSLGTYYHLQIQGHTDGIGGDDYNFQLGRARAEAVRNYLNEKLGIPLLRMSVQSFGAMEAKSYTAQSNRRIVVQVMQ